MLNRIKQKLVLRYISLHRFWERIVSLNGWKIKKLLKKIPNSQSKSLVSGGLDNKTFFLMSIKISTLNRQEIMKTTLNQCFSLLPKEAGITFRINDSSADDFYFSNEQYFKNLPSIIPEIQRTQVRLPGAYYQFLTEQNQPYCLTIFDDFPITNLTSSLLLAGCRLLEDFAGMVDVVLIEQVLDYKLDDQNKLILIELKDLEFRIGHIVPLGIVEYFGHKFAIIENFHYGFFFSTVLVSTKDHARRLKWYLDNISAENPHKIELAGSLRRGPIYRYIAVPLEAFKLDLDFEHTEISIRPAVVEAKKLYEALKNNNQFKILS